jgi:hypothetical protein
MARSSVERRRESRQHSDDAPDHSLACADAGGTPQRSAPSYPHRSGAAGINLCISEKPQVTIPLAIVEDVRTFRPEDTPDEFLEAIRTEIGYDAMTDEEKRIVDAGNQIAGRFPERLSKGELSAWIKERFL